MIQLIITVLITITMIKPTFALTTTAPPATIVDNPLSTNGASMVADWNYLKMDADKCSVKNILDELQADGGSAITAQELWVLKGGTWGSYSMTNAENTVSINTTIAFYSSSKFFFDMDPKACTINTDSARQEQIDQVRNISKESRSQGFAGSIIQKIEGLFSGTKKDEIVTNDSFETTKDINIKSNLNVIGDTTLWDTTITGQFKSGQMSLNSNDNSLEIVGAACGSTTEICNTQTLYLQKNLAGNIDLLNGKVVIMTNGDVIINGNVEAKKVITEQINIKSSGETLGISTIAKDTTEKTITTSSVKTNSKIFVTPINSTNGETIYIKDQTDGESFTVKIDNSINSDIKFNWFIINSVE